jgi:hypothetical protein
LNFCEVALSFFRETSLEDSDNLSESLDLLGTVFASACVCILLIGAGLHPILLFLGLVGYNLSLSIDVIGKFEHLLLELKHIGVQGGDGMCQMVIS